MLDVMIRLPTFHQGTTMTPGDFVIVGVIIGVIVAVILVATFFLAIAGQPSVQQQAQMKEAERPYAASLQPQGGEQPPAHAPEEEKILLRR